MARRLGRLPACALARPQWEGLLAESGPTLPTETRMDAGSAAFGKSVKGFAQPIRARAHAPGDICGGVGVRARMGQWMDGCVFGGEPSSKTIHTLHNSRRASIHAGSGGKGCAEKHLQLFPGGGQVAKESLRELMPVTAEWIDQLRAELGRDAVDAIVRAGVQGKGKFWARECGPDGQWREVGSRPAARPVCREAMR
ncbi:MAG: hypothetical protein RJA36_1938 [Pseudomonadota bacterium]